MFRNSENVDKPLFPSCLVHSFLSDERVLRYGANNKIDYSEHPTKVKHDAARTINIYAAIPEVAS